MSNGAQTGFNSVIHIEDYTEEGGRSLNLEEQYDQIYKYLYFRLHDQHTAEDLTQETFLRFIGSRTYQDENRQLQYLYTIARNLCSQYYRDKMIVFNIDEALDIPQLEESEQSLLERISLIDALQKLSLEEREMLLLRYVNDVPVPVISRLYHISRFAVYRRLKGILKKVKEEMEGENG